jgi:DNA-binding protein YbaB
VTDEFAEMVERSEVTVTTPNGQVTASVRGQREVTVRFAPGFYARCSTVQLQENLQTAARLLFAAARRDHLEQIRAFTGRDDVESRPDPQTPLDHDYYTRLAELSAEGESDDGLVLVSAVGQQHYVVQVKPGVLDRVPQEQLEASCGQAADRMLAETERKAASARWEVYLAPRSA